MKNIILSPSILAADFGKIGEQLHLLEKCNVPYVHVDVMDGNFVQNPQLVLMVIK